MRLNQSTRKWLPWLLLAVAVIATAAVYWSGLTGGWVFDDYPNIVDNAAIHIKPGHSTLVAWVDAALSSPASFLHRPLASITFALNWMAGGGNPWPFKLTNVIIHLINGVLLFFMLRALLRLMALRAPWLLPSPLGRGVGGEGPAPRDAPTSRQSEPSPAPAGHPLPKGARMGGGGPETNAAPTHPHPDPPLEGDGVRATRFPYVDDAAATRLALIVAAAWMLLPINLMAVLYVVQRMESLCQVFVLAGLWAYLHGRWMMLTAGDERRDRRGFALAVSGIVLGTLLGLTSKETAVLLPVFALLAEWVLLRFARKVEPLSLRERGRGEGSDTQRAAIARESGPSPAPSGHHGALGHGWRLYPEGEGKTMPAHSKGEGKDVLALPEGEDKQTADRRIWWLFVVTLFVPAVLGFAWLMRSALRPASWAGRDFTLTQRLLTEPRVLVDYLHWTLFPNPMVLSLYHDEIVKSTGILTPWTTLGAMLLLAALIAIAVWLRNRRPLVSLGIGWFFAGNLLTATIVPLELVYEQRMYFASIGVLLAAGALLLGRRWRIRLSLLRGLVVVVALLAFGTITHLRADEWSNRLRLAVAEANRHPESGRAVYEAGRLLLIASDYQPGKALDGSWKYLRKAAAIQGSSALPDQAMIMIADHQRQGQDATYWDSMVHKLRTQPTRQEDISALISLTNCYGANICEFEVAQLNRAYRAALSRPHPIARLDGAYADFQRDIMHNSWVAETYLARAVAGDPGEPAYRVDLAALYARHGETGKTLEQIDALRRMNFAGRLNGKIAALEQMVEQGKTAAPSAN
ncbi:MAG TPA: hypothetical protein VFW60_06825 [Rhodanobacteraceae bacterium]|nr:hypothetical protein [Rhodanobacteraceae bacterium]